MSKDEDFYYKEDKRYDRITRILGFFMPPFLVEWKMRVGKKAANLISKRALKIGTRVGKLIETEWKTGSFKLTSLDGHEVRQCMKAWADFKTDHAPEIIDMEVTAFHEKLMVAGTRDMRVRINGKQGILDLKTSKSIHLPYWLQTCFYREADPDPLDQESWILRLDKETGMYEFQSLTRAGFVYEECVTALYGLIAAFRFFTKHDKEISE